MALIRYPGSKSKLWQPICHSLLKTVPELVAPLWDRQCEYREPFFGSGAIGFRILGNISRRCRLWLNDVDADLVCLWRAVQSDPHNLCGLVGAFSPSAKAFYDFKARDGAEDCSDIERGFRKLALHRMSYSGLGYMSGGPLGGRQQDNAAYPVNCRWRPEIIKRDIQRLHKRLRRFDGVTITSQDFGELVSGADENCVMYLDPPYYEKGPDLYRFSMTDADHKRLAELLKNSLSRWVLSYDDHERIRELYSWADVEVVRLTYTTGLSKAKDGERPKNHEILIAPKANRKAAVA